MAEKSKSEPLPFEPRKKKKKKAQKAAPQAKQTTPVAKKTSVKETKEAKKARKKRNREEASLSAIPDAVSKRMTRRMVFLSGIPTAMGIASFFVFYWLFSQKIVEFPPYLVLFVTAGLFGLGFLGLSYSVFSASWDETIDGSLIGASEFKTNIGRTISAWKNRNKDE